MIIIVLCGNSLHYSLNRHSCAIFEKIFTFESVKNNFLALICILGSKGANMLLIIYLINDYRRLPIYMIKKIHLFIFLIVVLNKIKQLWTIHFCL